MQALSSSSSALSNKKQREVYVGNLTIGVVTDIMLRDLFNASLAHLCGVDCAPGQDISGAQQCAVTGCSACAPARCHANLLQ